MKELFSAYGSEKVKMSDLKRADKWIGMKHNKILPSQSRVDGTLRMDKNLKKISF